MKSSLHSGLSESLPLHRARDEDSFTDLTLNHEAGSFKVHRVIVCPQSKVFYKACTGGFEVEVVLYIQNIAEIVK